MTLANDLVQFLMHLFGDRQAAQDFLDNPEKVLDDHGLGGVCSADVDAAMPVVLDYAPVTVNASRFDREYNTGGNSARTDDNGGGGSTGGGNHGGGHHGGGNHGGGNNGGDDHAHAVQQLHHVVNNYSYTSTVDDRDTITDQSVNQNIWADGDVEQLFDNDSVVASGDRAIAAGDDADVEDSNNIEDSYNTDNSSDDSTDNSIRAGEDVNIGNTDIEADDSFNTDLDVDVEDSFNDDHSKNTDLDVDVEDSFNDESDHSVDVRDSGNDNSEKTEVNFDESFNRTDTDVDIDESFNREETDVDVDVEESFNDNSRETDITADLNNVGNTDSSTNLDDVLVGNDFSEETNTTNELEFETTVTTVADAELDDSEVG
jgi:hypothetical protein